MKRLFAILCLTIIFAGTASALSQTFPEIPDVPVDDPNYFDIRHLYENGIVQGYEDGSFKPDQTINRAEFTKIMVGTIVGQKPLEHAGSCFSDVSTDDWFYPYVCYAERTGMINGYPDGSFKPAQNIQFVEAAKIISNGFELESGSDEIWYRPFVMNLTERRAVPTSILSFDKNITRREMAVMIYRLRVKDSVQPSVSYEMIETGVIDGPTTTDELPRGRITSTNTNGNEVIITTDSNYRYIQSNGLPNHSHGEFPNPNNPHAITEQGHNFRVPLNPLLASNSTYQQLGKFGVGLNGIPFDPGAAEYYNSDRNSGWQYEALGGGVNLGLDDNHAHVQPNGSYHYHGLPTGLIEENDESRHSPLIGYAADGFPIYAMYGFYRAEEPTSSIVKMKSSYVLKSGTRTNGPGGTYDGTFVEDYEYVEGHGDLDECHGRYGVTPDYPEGSYMYFITDEFVYVGRCWKGTPDASFTQGRAGGYPGQTGPNDGPIGGPPQETR